MWASRTCHLHPQPPGHRCKRWVMPALALLDFLLLGSLPCSQLSLVFSWAPGQATNREKNTMIQSNISEWTQLLFPSFTSAARGGSLFHQLKCFSKWLKHKGSWRYFLANHMQLVGGFHWWIHSEPSVKGQRLQPMSCHLTEISFNPDQCCTMNHSVEQLANLTALRLVAKVHYFDLYPRCYLLQWCLGPKMWSFSPIFTMKCSVKSRCESSCWTCPDWLWVWDLGDVRTPMV